MRRFRLSASFLSKVLAIALLFSVVGTMFEGNAPVSALSGSDFHAGHIIDDTIFTNSSAMSVGQIQNFLNSKVPTCDTNGTISKSYYYNASTGRINNSADTWVTTSRAVYGQRYDAANNTTKAAAPYVCLKDYVENPTTLANNLQNPGASVPGGQSAAQIIYNEAQAYQINPQVLIVTLQKEQGLVTDDWPWTNEYQIAMGYGCPDTAPCDSQYYGFANQVFNAARQFRRYFNNPTNYNYTVGNDTILYNPDSSCGSSVVNIQNQATADLYDYTPYQPNAGALAGVSDSSPGGTATCGAYGNRNFWWYFNTWFGTSIAPSYSWQILNTTYNTGSNTVGLGQSATVTVYAENTGTATWYNGGANPVRLGLWDSTSSPLYTSGWFASNRPANMTQSQVSPGGTATFTFPINTNAVGTFIPKLNLVVENSQWLPWPGFSPTINIVNGYSWSVQNVIYSSGGGILEPGGTQHITVKALNTGSVTWSQSSGPKIELGEWGSSGASPVNNNWISPNRAATMDEASVAPGNVGTFEFDVRVPGMGNYYDRLNLVAEGLTWFNDAGLTLYLRGGVDTWQPLWSAYSLGGNANIARGTSFYVTVKAKNTGDLTWTNGTTGLPPIRLATANPINRGSILYDSSWLNSARPVALLESSVAPGQQGTFVFKVTVPNNAPLGPYNEYFSLVAEGEQWFNNPNFSIYVNVTP